MTKSSSILYRLVPWVALLALLLAVPLAFAIWRHRRGAPFAGTAPTPLPEAQAPAIAEKFDFPLDPEQFGPYLPYVSGPLPVDTRFDVQNPGVGKDGKCFVDQSGTPVPFDQLYHAGEDWFALDGQGRVLGRGAAGVAVHAIANGVVSWVQSLGSEGYVLVVAHVLPDDDPASGRVWSVYWHIADIQVALGEAVIMGQTLGIVHDRGLNSHLHWEVRTFADATTLFIPDSAGGRGACNGYVAGVGYTWDDDPALAHPQAWGYLNPSDFVVDRVK